MRTVVIFLLAAASCVAQPVPADRVVSIMPGRGQNIGQGSVFFPMNVLGMPDTTARIAVASTDPRQVCSIGLEGEIVLGFREHAIVDGPGIDVVIYENAFTYSNGRRFAEPGRVALSRDGVTWVDFPHDERTLQGCAGVTPTDPSLPFGGGDGFDLATIGIDSVRFVRITDITQRILDDASHPFYDPSLSGFDLDAVVAYNAVRVVDHPTISFDPVTERIDIGLPPSMYGTVSCHDIGGSVLRKVDVGPGRTGIDVRTIPPGLVLIVLSTPSSTTTLKVLR